MSDQNTNQGGAPGDKEQQQQSGNFLTNTVSGGLSVAGGIFGAGTKAAEGLSTTAGNLIGDTTSQVTGGRDNAVSNLARSGGESIGGVFGAVGGAVKNATGAAEQQSASERPTQNRGH